MKESEMEMEEINGPLAPTFGGLIYQINLGSGFIATNPTSFGPDAVIAPDGKFLTPLQPVFGPDEEEAGESRFEGFARTILAVPKSEADAEEAKRTKRMSRKR